MRVAQSVLAVGEGDVGSEAVVDEEVFEAGKKSHSLNGLATALGVKVVAGEAIGAEDVQPMTFPMKGAACFVGMKDGAFDEGFTDGSHREGGFCASFFEDVCKGALTQGTVKKFGKGLTEAVVWNELVAA